jgi:hypothetical protein
LCLLISMRQSYDHIMIMNPLSCLSLIID